MEKSHRIKGLRDKPLLVEPGADEFGWMRVRPADIEAMEGMLTDKRGNNQRFTLCYLLYRMRGLGLDVTVTEGDRKMLTAEYGDVIRGDSLADTLEWTSILRELGLEISVDDGDRGAITKAIYDARVRGLKDEEGKWWGHILFAAKSLGCQVEVTPKDAEVMRRALEAARGDELVGGYTIAETHYFMRELGVAEAITEGDIKLMKEKVEEGRKTKNGGDIAWMLYYLNRLFPRKEKTDTPLPPLKEYGK